jgi:putative NADH-flavin reductase
MKVAVFGAAGRTGVEVIRAALAKGHEVTAVVRDASAVTEEKVTVAVADVHDQDQVTAAVTGVDAVISTLGGKPRQPTSVYSDGIVKITTAMRASGARRLLCLSTGALDQSKTPAMQRFVQGIIVKLVFKYGHADMGTMERTLRGVDDLDWTVVRVPGLTAKPATGKYRVATAPLDKPSMIGRADLADYLVSALGDTSTFRTVQEISN